MTSLRAAALIAVVGISSIGLSGCGKASSAAAQPVAKTPTADVVAKSAAPATAAASKALTRQQLLNRPIPPTPKKPILPAAAKVNTTQGAIAFVQYYHRLLDYGYRVGDATSLIAAFDPYCEDCANRVKDLKNLKVAQVQVLDPIDFIAVHRSLRIDSSSVIVHVYHQPTRNTRIKPERGPMKIQTDAPYKAEVIVTWERGRWRVYDEAPVWETAEQVRANG